MKRRVMAGVLAAAMSVTLLAGCGGGASSGGTSGGSSAQTQTESTAAAAEAEAPAQESGAKSSAMSKVVVNIWDSKQQKGIQTICDEWTATSGIPVSVEVVDWDNYWTLLEAGASGGQMPDVFWMHSQYSEKYMDQGILLDLPFNCKVAGFSLFGTIIVAGTQGDEFADVSISFDEWKKIIDESN